jgi:hypothetical protein
VNRFSRFSALWASFYSRDLYREVGSAWKGIGVLYLMLLLGICWLPSAARWSLGLREFAATEAKAIVRQLPTITIQKGVMTANPAGRHVIRLDDGSDEGLLVIDDSVDTVPSAADGDLFVLTRREAGMIRASRNERRVWALTPAADMDLTPGEVGDFVSSLALWVPPIGYVGAVAGSLIFRVLQTLLYGAFATTYARKQRVTLDYTSGVRLAAVAVTPVVVIRTLIWFGPWEPGWYVRWPIALLITLGYIAFGIRAMAAAPSATVQAG